MKTHLTLLFCLTALIVACKKETVAADSNTNQTHETVKEFDSCSCAAVNLKDAADSQYIKAEINGIPICFDADPQLGDTFPNMLKYGVILRDTGSQYYDNLYMIRNARNSHWQLALFFENTHALTKTYPYSLPRKNPEVCEIGELQLNDLDHYISCTWCPENKYNYWAQFFGYGVKMTATNFLNGVFEGNFEGVVSTGSGKTASIKNGRFRIKLVVFESDIDLR